MTMERHFQVYRTCLETLTASTIDALDAHLSEDVHFRDPFHDVRGREAMKGAISRLFAAAEDVSFQIGDHAVVSNCIFFHWRLSAVLRGRDWNVEGVTIVAFDEMGNVSSHEEYWDAASQMYERLPVIGSLLRYLRRRIAGP